MNYIENFVKKYPKVIIGVVILLTVLFGYQATKIEINTDIKDMFPDGDPAVETFDRISSEYGGSEYVILMLKDRNIMDPSSLQHINYLTKQIKQIKGVNQVRSITNIEEIRGKGFTIEIGEFIEDLPKTETQAAKLASQLEKKDRYLGTLVSKDSKAATLIAQLGPEANQKHVVSKVQQLRKKEKITEKSYLTGSPVLSKELADNMRQDIMKLLPFVSVMVMLILFSSFHSFRGVALPLIIVLISVVWTVGLIAWMGKTLSIVSTILPVLLVSVGSAYAIHFLARYYEDLDNGLNKDNAVSESIKKVGIAIAMAGVTTIVGFSSLGFSELTIIRDFGLFTAFGVFCALVISITFLPAVLYLLDCPDNLRAAEEREFLDSIFAGIAYFVKRYPGLIVGGVIIICILSIVVIPQIRAETNYITFFAEGSEIRKANNLVNRKFGGSESLEIIIDTGKKNGIKNPQLLEKVENFQEELEKINLLSNSMSVVDLLKEENQALHGGKEKFEVVPKQGIGQFLLMLSSGENILKDFTDFKRREIRIRVMVESANSKQKEAMLKQVRDLIDREFGNSGYEVTLTGIPVLTNILTDMIISSQIKSLISSILCAFVITSLLFKSPIKGFACSFPIAVTVLFNFGLMGWSSVPLNVATSMIASIAVGVGVDYSIHFYTRYLEEREAGASLDEGLETAINTIGRANYFNATAVTAGFLVLLFSSTPPLRTFGLLTSITMLVSFLGAMVLLPGLIKFRAKYIKPLLQQEEGEKVNQ